MFSYISNLIGGGSAGGKSSSSSSYNEKIAVDGTLIEYVTKSKNPKTAIMKAQLIIDKSESKGRDIELVIKNKEFDKEKISFLLEEAMEFGQVVDQPVVIAYCWVNGNTIWVFKFSEKNYELSKCLSRLAYECIFENREDRDFDEEKDSYDDLLMDTELPFDVDTLVMFKTASSPVANKPTVVESKPSPKTVATLPVKETSSVKPPVATQPTTQPSQSLYPSLQIGDEQTRKKSYEKSIGGKLEEICSAKCDLYLLDEKTHIYELKRENVTATIYEVLDEEGDSNFDYVMDISIGDERLIIQDINSEMNAQFYNQFHSITWNFTNPFSSWSLIFKNLDEESEFKTNLSRSIYEFNTCNDFFKLAIEDQEMLVKTSAIDQSIGNSSKYLQDLDYEDEDYVDFISDSEEEESEDEEEVVPSGGKQPGLPKYTNSFMLDSSQRERTFVIRGSDIGVFKRDDDTDHPVFDTQIKNVSTTKGELFVPYKAMLHNQDRDLLFLHKDQDNEDHCGKVYRMDITRGEVVETWNTFQDYVPITEIKPTEKFGDQLPTQVFGALNDNAVFALDPRIHGSDKVVGNISAITSNSKPQFSCFATTSDGRLVVGSEKGEIRMFSGIPNLDKTGKKGTHPKSAKTLLPGLGDEIIGIDVTYNGEWVVATCKTYLMVINTSMPNSDTTGFTERMGKNKPIPRKIQLLPEDIKQVGGSVSFKPAKFNSGIDGELWIVTSTGPYLITWNFKRITQNSLFDYTMKKVNNNENVVMSEFKSVRINEEGRHAPIIVTTPNDVLLEKKKKTSTVPYKKRTTQYKK